MNQEIDFAYKASLSLFHDKPEYPSVRRRPLLFELSSNPVEGPLNREEELLSKSLHIIQERKISLPLEDRSPYWLDNQSYNPWKYLGHVSNL